LLFGQREVCHSVVLATMIVGWLLFLGHCSSEWFDRLTTNGGRVHHERGGRFSFALSLSKGQIGEIRNEF